MKGVFFFFNKLSMLTMETQIQSGNLLSEEWVWNKDHVIILIIKITEINAVVYQMSSNMINFSKYY